MINKDREIRRRLAKLDALENGGVDNWEHYDTALQDWYKENHEDEFIDEAINDIGYNFDEERMYNILKKLIQDCKDA